MRGVRPELLAPLRGPTRRWWACRVACSSLMSMPSRGMLSCLAIQSRSAGVGVTGLPSRRRPGKRWRLKARLSFPVATLGVHSSWKTARRTALPAKARFSSLHSVDDHVASAAASSVGLDSGDSQSSTAGVSPFLRSHSAAVRLRLRGGRGGEGGVVVLRAWPSPSSFCLALSCAYGHVGA